MTARPALTSTAARAAARPGFRVLLGALVLLGAMPSHAIYWNLFNIEGESAFNAVYVTYGTLGDMLTDSNRTGSFQPDTTGGVAENVVGSGAVPLGVPPPPPSVPEPTTLLMVATGLAAMTLEAALG